MTRRALSYFLLSAGVCFLLPIPTPVLAQSCVCPPPQSVKEAFDRASLVVIAQVQNVTKSGFRVGENEVRMTLQRIYKTVEEIPTNVESVTVYTPEKKELCGTEFAAGLDYVIFASGSPAHLVVNSCSRSKILDVAAEEIQALSQIAPPKKGAAANNLEFMLPPDNKKPDEEKKPSKTFEDDLTKPGYRKNRR